jgi:hypothetical protein
MAHVATLAIDSAERAWVDEWAGMVPDAPSPWYLLEDLCAVPFTVRAAWLAARLGKPFLPAYKKRLATPRNTLEALEAGWGLAAMALRHEGLRNEISHFMGSRKQAAEDPEWLRLAVQRATETAKLLEEKEESLRQEGVGLGRGMIVALTADLPEGSPHRYARAEDVPDELARTALLTEFWLDAHNHEKGPSIMIVALVHAASARAEDFYYPASFLQAMERPDLEELGESLVAMRRGLYVPHKTIVREETPGRNDPCSCGSGKKFKKCHGR